MHKHDNYLKDMNKDEKRDDAGNVSEHIRSHDVVAADAEHGAYRPRMNTVFNKHTDKQFKEHDGRHAEDKHFGKMKGHESLEQSNESD
jgi:hypothetical protein